MTHVVITGSNRGIGRALAESALARGWRVTGTSRNGSAIPGLDVVDLDLADQARINHAFRDLSPVDILINNAGVIGPERQSSLDMDFAGFSRALSINTLAPLAVAQACLPALRQSVGATILSISSQMAWMGYRKSDRIAYRASKAALNKVMQGLATDLEPEGITVALIDPGWVRTDMGGAEADQHPRDVAEGVLDLAGRLSLKDTGKFFRFTGQERPF